jgi:hypothetical protein
VAHSGRSIAIASSLVVGLAGCMTEPGGGLNNPDSEDAPYVGVFTGEYVDGIPLYRFPPIHVVGSRGSGDDM